MDRLSPTRNMWLRELLVAGKPHVTPCRRAFAPPRIPEWRVTLVNRVAFLASLAGVVASIIAAHAQSFDCRYARYLDEKTICRDQVLGRLDEQLGSVYRQLLLQVPKQEREKLDKEEEEFVIAR